MLSNFAKIFIKYTLSLFALLSVSQDILSMDKDWINFFENSESDIRRGDDKENPHVINMRLDIRIIDKNDSPRRPLQPVNQQKSRQSRYDDPQDLGVPVAGSKADVETSAQNKRPRPDFSSSHEESSEDPVPESECSILFDASDKKRVYEVQILNKDPVPESKRSPIFGVLNEKQGLEAQILNAALYKSDDCSVDVDLECFSPTKINGYYEAGGTASELIRNITVLKTLYP